MFWLFISIFCMTQCHLLQDDDVLLAGYNLYGTRDFESSINKNNIDNLKLLFKKPLCGPMTATPFVKNGEVTISDFGGCIHKYDGETGAIILEKNMTEFGFPPGLYARIMPAYYNHTLIFATGSIKTPLVPGVGSWLFAIGENDFTLKWKVLITDFPWSVVSQSPIIRNDIMYFGMSSGEFATPIYPGYNCCSFSGTMYAYNASNGAKIWEWRAIPDDLRGIGKFSGASIWSGTPIIVDNDLYLATGQLYNVSQASIDCINTNPTNMSCIDSRVIFDSTVRLNALTGAFKNSFRGVTADAWNLACYLRLPSCQTPLFALDFDMTTVQYSKKTNTLYSASKSGEVFSFNRDLTLRWRHMLVLGSMTGGIRYQNALHDDNDLDDMALYVSNGNGDQHSYKLLNGTNSTVGAWIKYDGNGKIKWITPAPREANTTGAITCAAVTITNNLMIGYFEPLPNAPSSLAFLNTQTGKILKTYKLSSRTGSAPAIVGKNIYTGTGVLGQTTTVPPADFYAFTVRR